MTLKLNTEVATSVATVFITKVYTMILYRILAT